MSNNLYINISTILNNYFVIKNIASQSIIIPVVKADAYGLGALIIVEALIKHGCNDFFTSSLEEAVSLRINTNNHINIFVLNGVYQNNYKEFIKYNITPVLNNLYQINIWQEHAYNSNILLPAIIHVNTGINRLGLSEQEFRDIINNRDLIKNIKLIYIISHLSISQDAQSSYNHMQLNIFKEYLKYFKNIKASISNSHAVFLGKEYHLDMIRLGAMLYGINPLQKSNMIKNPIKLESTIIHLQNIPKNSYIGYDMSFKTTRQSTIATIPIGYADGYPRSGSNKAFVYISGYKSPIVGFISMDLMTIDVTDIPFNQVFIGQKVELINDNYTPSNLANDANTVGYEILTRLKEGRYNRIYVE